MGTTCHSKLDGAVDGTSCGEDKVSFSSHDRDRKMVVMRLLILVFFISRKKSFVSGESFLFAVLICIFI